MNPQFIGDAASPEAGIAIFATVCVAPAGTAGPVGCSSGQAFEAARTDLTMLW